LAFDFDLANDDLAAIELAVPKSAAVGGRYAAAKLDRLDSEKRQRVIKKFPTENAWKDTR
jgi:hypothetical protein